MLTGQEVAKHASKDDLWMIIKGKVYDLTEFAPSHPGGIRILLKYAGKDATEEYEPIHPPGTIEETLSPDKHLGEVDMSTVEKVVIAEVQAVDQNKTLVSLAECLNLFDIERAAEGKLKTKAYAYYASAADDERTKTWNHDAFTQVRLRPRVLRNVTHADISSTLLGHSVSMPIFIAPAAMGRLAHPEGERCLVRMAGVHKIPYMVSANASISFEEIASLKVPGQMLIYQLYVNKDRSKTEATLRRVVAAGYSAVCVTVDAPVAGKRERDERATLDAESAADPSMQAAGTTPAESGIAKTLIGNTDADLKWSDLAWIKSVTDGLPLIVKGVQTAEDAALCVRYGVDAVYLSNHGGRQLEGAPAAIETLLEIRRHEPHVLDKCEVYVDGGVKRGTDVLKALALGAKACGVGRPFMYSLVFGDRGVDKIATILRDEIALNLRLLGATKLSELDASMVNARALEMDVIPDEEYRSPSKTDGFGQGVKDLVLRVVGKAKL